MRCAPTAGGFLEWPLQPVSSAPEYGRPLSCFKVLVSVREPPAADTLAGQCLDFLGPLFAAAFTLAPRARSARVASRCCSETAHISADACVSATDCPSVEICQRSLSPTVSL